MSAASPAPGGPVTADIGLVERASAAAPPGLTLHQPSHSYWLDGQRVPSVTEIVRPLLPLAGIPYGVLEAARHLGSAVHRACELADRGVLDTASVAPPLLPYLQAWSAFSAAHQVQWSMVESLIYHERLRYAGTLDRFGWVQGRLAVVDLKTSARLYPAVGPQLAAYAQALSVPGGDVLRLGVRLKKDATFEVQVFRDPLDWAVFASLLTLRNFCAQHRITPQFKEPMP